MWWDGSRRETIRKMMEQDLILQSWLWQIVRSLILQIVRVQILKRRRKIRYEI